MNKDRRKTIIVALLAVCALGVVAWTLFGDRLMKATGKSGAAVSAGSAAPVAAASPAQEAAAASPTGADAQVGAAPGTPLEPARPVDLAIVDSQFVSWVEAPRRDPFHLYVPPAPKAQGPRAAEVLSLNAIWRQSGGRFAVINKRVLTEGDQIASFRLEKIDATAVWVVGTNGTERLEFQAGVLSAQPQNKKETARPAPPGGGTTRERKLPS